MVADGVQDQFDAYLLTEEDGNNHDCRQDQHRVPSFRQRR